MVPATCRKEFNFDTQEREDRFDITDTADIVMKGVSATISLTKIQKIKFLDSINSILNFFGKRRFNPFKSSPFKRNKIRAVDNYT